MLPGSYLELLDIAGDLEDVEIELGVRDKRDTPRRNYFLEKHPWLNNIKDNIDIQFTRKNKLVRNDICPCGSGKKYKKCCIDNAVF